MKTICMAAPALAGECDAWKAGIDMDEGGPTMVASICAAGRPEAWLSVTCGGEARSACASSRQPATIFRPATT